MRKIFRLSSKHDFRYILNRGYRVDTPFFTAFYCLGKISPQSFNFLVGVVCSKKISLKAVDRNHVRRLLYRCAFAHSSKYPGNLRLVLLAKKSILSASYEEVCSAFNKILSAFSVS